MMDNTQFLLGWQKITAADETKDFYGTEWSPGLPFGSSRATEHTKSEVEAVEVNLLIEKKRRINGGRTCCLVNEPSRIPTAEQLCQHQIDCHRIIYFYCQGIYERYYRERDDVYSKDFQYDGVCAKDFPDSAGPWPSHKDAWDAYSKAWSHVYGNEKLHHYPQMRESILDRTFRLGMHTLLWPGWRWIFIKDHAHTYYSRLGEILFPTTLENREALPQMLGGSVNLVSLSDSLFQIDIGELNRRREGSPQAEKNMAELDAAYEESA